MKASVSIACALVLGVTLIAVTSAQAPPSAEAKPSIAGHYVLDHRVLPDGSEVRPPEVIGMLTYTADRRNFNVYWKQDGKPASIGMISKYALRNTEYTEESIYYATNGIGGKGPEYVTDPVSGKAPVKIEGEQISFTLPLHGEPSVVFTPMGFTATREGEFVDHWKKVE